MENFTTKTLHYINIQEWAGEMGARLGGSYKFYKNWAIHASAGCAYAIGLTERTHRTPDWAKDEIDMMFNDMIMEDMRETIPVQYVRDIRFYVKIGVSISL